MGPSNTSDRGTWLRLLARWGLLTALAVAGLMTTFFTAYGLVSSQPGIVGGPHDELVMAATVPGLYRTAMVFDALGWLTMGGLIVIAGLALRRDAPLRGPLAAALGVTAVVGVIGAFLRLFSIGELGRLLAGGAADADMLAPFRSVEWVITAAFATGQLTVGLGFLVVGSAALAVAWMPRRIAWLLLLPGVTSLVLLVAQIVLDTFLFPLLLVHVGLLAAAGLAMAATWWRAPSPSVATVTLESAGSGAAA